jgi:hypothetical protein
MFLEIFSQFLTTTFAVPQDDNEKHANNNNNVVIYFIFTHPLYLGPVQVMLTSPFSAAPALVLVIRRVVLEGSEVKPHQLAEVLAAPITVH